MEGQSVVTNHRSEIVIDIEPLANHIKPEPVEEESEYDEYSEEYEAHVGRSEEEEKRFKTEPDDGHTFPVGRVKEEITEEEQYNDEFQEEEGMGSVSEDESYDKPQDKSYCTDVNDKSMADKNRSVDYTYCDNFKGQQPDSNVKVGDSSPRVAQDSSQINGYSDNQYVNDTELSESKEHIEKTLICNVCMKAFKRLSHLKRHKLIHSDYRPFQCLTCMVKFSTSSNLKRHISIQKCKPPHDDDIIKVDGKEKTDVKSDKPTEDFTVHALPSTSSESDNMIYFEIPPVENFQQCGQCGKISVNPKENTPDAKYICMSCIKEGDTLIEVGVKDFNVYECDICTKKFDRASTLNRHKLIHSGEKSFECDICSIKFNLLCNLKQHKRIHTNNKLFVCNICGKNFRQSSNLKQHKLIHSGEKPYQCSICMKKFNQSSTLKTHKRTHTGEKPFECNICKKKFSWSYHLKRHAITHQNAEKIECNLCGTLFSHPSYLQRHMQKKHPK